MGELPKNLGSVPPGAHKARAPLGTRLMQIREKVVASGEPLLPWDALERELAERRGDVTSENR